MLFKSKPDDFSPKFEVVTGFLMHQGRFLVMQYSAGKKVQPNRWGTPAGKLSQNEGHLEGLTRELLEETGIVFAPDQFEYVDTFFIRYPAFDYTYHMYKTELPHLPETITIDPGEHQAFRWVTPEEAAMLDLIDEELPCIERVCSQ
jgi:8-oxo-dGTP diphosphatase